MKKALSLIILSALLLSSCGLFGGINEPPAVTDEAPTPTPSEAPSGSELTPVASGDGRFSLRYSSQATLNPLVGTDADNMALSTLMYEGLFRLNASFGYENVLCESFETIDSVTYDFKVREDIYFSDGSELTAYDVVYSINTARNNSRYESRLKNIKSVQIAEGSAVRVVLEKADARFPALLDFGIIKDGTSGTAPRGTGCYKYEEADGTAFLTANLYHEKAASLPVSTIYLEQCADTELGELFTESIIDIFADDPNATIVSVRRDHETRYYNTTVLQYIGFCSRTSAVTDSRFRAVVELAVDRDAIANDVLGTRASPAFLALPDYYRLYDPMWETHSDQNALVAMSGLLSEIGMRDADSDTYLEYPHMGEYTKVSLVFLVNSENPARVRAADMIVDRLRRVGINVELRELPFDEYTEALEAGDFDLYYGETRLPANFDFSELVSPGGALDYGSMATESYAEKVDAYRAARGEFAERNAARELVLTLSGELPFIPVAYKQYAVHSGRNEILGISPVQTGLYWNIFEWTIDVK